MSQQRRRRRKYYDIFSPFYDAFILLHSGKDKEGTRDFLVGASSLGHKEKPRVLNVCCGTGAVTLAFKERFPGAVVVGLDFSPGMLRKAKEKDASGTIAFVEGDAAELPYVG